MSQFKDLKSKAGLAELNTFLESRPYVDGWTPSSADVSVFDSVGTAPNGFPHALRWYNNINSFQKNERSGWPKAQTSMQNGAVGGDDDEEDDVDLFGDSDEEEDEEKERIKQERLKAYEQKKSKKGPGPVAKSSVILDVKPWDDETDMKMMENSVRGIEMDGLLWGAGKLVPLAYGIKKLQIMCIVEDEKVSIDDLQERITEEFEDFVQSVDVAAFNKI